MGSTERATIGLQCQKNNLGLGCRGSNATKREGCLVKHDLIGDVNLICDGVKAMTSHELQAVTYKNTFFGIGFQFVSGINT